MVRRPTPDPAWPARLMVASRARLNTSTPISDGVKRSAAAGPTSTEPTPDAAGAPCKPAWAAAKEKSCFLKPGTELDERFSAMVSCQRSIACKAEAAW